MTPEERVARRQQLLLEARKWVRVIPWQAERFGESLYELQDARRELPRGYSAIPIRFQDASYRRDAEQHFLLVAVNHLATACKRLGREMPQLDNHVAELLRDAYEHWDDPTGRAHRKLAEAGIEGHSTTTWGMGGVLLAGVVSADDLLGWVDTVEEALDGLTG